MPRLPRPSRRCTRVSRRTSRRSSSPDRSGCDHRTTTTSASRFTNIARRARLHRPRRPSVCGRRAQADSDSMRCPFVTIFLIVAAVVACGAVAGNPPSVAFTDVTAAAGLRFVHNNGAFGSKYLPETLGSGCLFPDADGEGWQDILLLNSTNWPGHVGPKSSLAVYRNHRYRSFTDGTGASGRAVEVWGRVRVGAR